MSNLNMKGAEQRKAWTGPVVPAVPQALSIVSRQSGVRAPPTGRLQSPALFGIGFGCGVPYAVYPLRMRV